MLRSSSLIPGTLLFAFAVMIAGLAGCGQSTQEAQQPQDSAQAHSHNGHDHGHNQADDKEITAALAKLSAKDRALAEKQTICPVGGERLGSMGTPIKMTVEGRDVFICCEGCEDAVREDPEKYFVKLDQHAH